MLTSIESVMKIIVKPPKQKRQAGRPREKHIRSKGEGNNWNAVGTVIIGGHAKSLVNTVDCLGYYHYLVQMWVSEVCKKCRKFCSDIWVLWEKYFYHECKFWLILFCKFCLSKSIVMFIWIRNASIVMFCNLWEMNVMFVSRKVLSCLSRLENEFQKNVTIKQMQKIGNRKRYINGNGCLTALKWQLNGHWTTIQSIDISTTVERQFNDSSTEV